MEAEQEVDSFGRIILIKRDDRKRSRSRDNDRGNDRDRPVHTRDARPQSHRAESGGFHRGPRDAYETADRTSRHASHSNALYPLSAHPMLKSYKTFMLSQTDDAPPEVWIRRYNDYQAQHVSSFVSMFFENNKTEDWFSERYDPAKRQALLQETRAWAVAESEQFRASAAGEPEKMLLACSLEPTATKAKESPALTGRHISGHVDCTICLSGVPSSCSKAGLRSSLLEALPDVVRLAVSQPRWIQTKEIGRVNLLFERTAWVVLPSPDAAKAALAKLQNLRINVAGPIDSSTGVASVLYTFSPHATLHSPTTRAASPLPDAASSPSRVSVDFKQALELSRVLDSFQGIPEEARIATVLASLNESELFKASPTHGLDLVLAYLRRVHLVSYYESLRFRDEAHLLSIAPEAVFRRVGFASPFALDDGARVEYNMGFNEVLRVAELEAAARNAQAVGAFYVPTEDERDARYITEKTEQLMDALVEQYARPEGEGKGRCGFKWCNKLFKGTEYLTKHIRTRHVVDFSAELLAISAPFMKARYEAEDLALRPLPPIEVETVSGVEFVSVQSVLETLQRPAPPLPAFPHPHLAEHRDDRRMMKRAPDLGRPFRPRRDPPPAPPPEQENPRRPVSTYGDSTAPKVRPLTVALTHA